MSAKASWIRSRRRRSRSSLPGSHPWMSSEAPIHASWLCNCSSGSGPGSGRRARHRLSAVAGSTWHRKYSGPRCCPVRSRRQPGILACTPPNRPADGNTGPGPRPPGVRRAGSACGPATVLCAQVRRAPRRRARRKAAGRVHDEIPEPDGGEVQSAAGWGTRPGALGMAVMRIAVRWLERLGRPEPRDDLTAKVVRPVQTQDRRRCHGQRVDRVQDPRCQPSLFSRTAPWPVEGWHRACPVGYVVRR